MALNFLFIHSGVPVLFLSALEDKTPAILQGLNARILENTQLINKACSFSAWLKNLSWSHGYEVTVPGSYATSFQIRDKERTKLTLQR
jgi:hypothetical protein